MEQNAVYQSERDRLQDAIYRDFKAAVADVRDMVAAVERTGEGDDLAAYEAALVAINSAISDVETRAGWHALDGSRRDAGEFRMRVRIGGLAVRIVGALDDAGEPASARLEVPGWPARWAGFATTFEDDTAILAFARHAPFAR